MARMYPPTLIGASVPNSERRVFTALAELGDDWMVFHSVAWQGERGGRQGDGEADFVIAHRSRGMLVLEVKGGEISADDGRWFSTDHHGETHSIDPFTQVRHSKHVLGGYLAERVSRVGTKVTMGHAVVFPDVVVDADLTPEAPREVIIDADDLRDPNRAVGRVARHWDATARFDDRQFRELRQALAPTWRIRRRLRTRIEETTEQIVDLTAGQVRALSMLRFQKRAVITGGPGTGKTVLAVERARQLAAEGQRVLLVCFNKPLGEALAAEVSDEENITATNFHGLAYEMAERCDLLPEGEPDADFWAEGLPELLPEAAERLGVRFDALVVDEGQDFLPGWWTALQLLLEDPDEGSLYVFADLRQSIYTEGAELPIDTPPFVLDVNCRNTNQIAARVAAVFGEEIHSLGVDGEPARFVTVRSGEDLGDEALEVCADLIEEGDLEPDQVVILSTRKKVVQELRGRQAAGHTINCPGGGGTTAETVHRFKGLESDAVILVIPEIHTDRDRALAYIGMSRARASLTVIGDKTVREALNWPG